MEYRQTLVSKANDTLQGMKGIFQNGIGGSQLAFAGGGRLPLSVMNTEAQDTMQLALKFRSEPPKQIRSTEKVDIRNSSFKAI